LLRVFFCLVVVGGLAPHDAPPRWCIEMGKSPYDKAAPESTGPDPVNPKK
jgi:hypothetical protein